MTAVIEVPLMRVFEFGKMAVLPEGPWVGEPDKVTWVDPASDMDCMVRRNNMGVWCGYVGVPPGHEMHGKDYDDVDADVHGGLTFAGLCEEGEPIDGICHVPFPGRPTEVWWLGFDCGHFRDVHPLMDYRLRQADPTWDTEFPALDDGFQTYKTVAYAQAVCVSLAAQLAAVT